MIDNSLSHLDGAGRAHMVDVSDKDTTVRAATASGQLRCSAATLKLVRDGKTPKGAVISPPELAGIMAAKQTSNLIPLCHPLALSRVSVQINPNDAPPVSIFVVRSGRRGKPVSRWKP